MILMTISNTYYKDSFPTGSSYVCNPPVTTTDIDTMYYTTMDLQSVLDDLIADGWVYSGNDKYPPGNWMSLRKGKYNALFTNDLVFYRKFYHATELAKQLNLLQKEARIALFQQYVHT